jgi:hypothetical protein
MLDFLCVFGILISVMRNLNDLKEQIQEDIVTFFDGMNYVDGTCSFLVSNMCKEWEDGSDIDKLCQIVVDRFKELENDNPKLLPFFEQKL